MAGRRQARNGVRLLAGALALGALADGRAAAAEPAPDKVACARSYERAQREREVHRLRSARDELLVCARAECPQVLRQDCTTWLGEVDAALPSVVIVARATDGRAPANVRVTVDGVVVAERTPDAPLTLDPGEHELAFDLDGAPRVARRLGIKEGERNVRVLVTFDAPPPRTSAPRPDVDRDRAPAREHGRDAAEAPVPPAVWVLGAGGLVLTGVGAAFQIAGMSERSSLGTCAPRCAPGDVDAARRNTWIGNVGIGLGVVSLAAAAILYLTRPRAAATAAAIAQGAW